MSAGPLGERELDELDALLAAEGLPEETMDLAMLDGFLAALAAGPTRIEPDIWLPQVWGGDEAAAQARHDFPADAARVEALARRHADFLLAELQAEPEAYTPILYTAAEGGEIAGIEEWCVGFVLAMNLDEAAWQPMLDDAAAEEFLAPILLHGTEAGAEELERKPELAARDAGFAATLADAVLDVYDYWTPERAARTTVRLATPKVGRNDPCPCGSGRKFKKCCGAGQP
jgi:uncharacterized protein